MTATTAHTCGGPVFGRKTPGYPRCDELLAGAPPVRWAGSYCGSQQRAVDDGTPAAEIRAHDCAASGCGRVCTFGQW